MGRLKFRLSDMMPNAWFYKLKDMGRTGKKATTSSHIPTPPPPSPMKHPGVIHPGRASYYVPSAEDKYLDSPVFRLRASDAKFLIVDSPRKSKEKQRRAAAGKKAPKVVLTSSSSVSSGCSCRAAWKAEALPEYPLVEAAADDYDGIPCSDKPVVSEHLQCSSKEVPCSCRVTSSAAADNITDVNGVSRKAGSVFDAAVAEIDLPPILTKPARRAPEGYGFSRHEPITPAIKEQRRRSSAGTQHGGLGLRMRTNSPRIAASRRAIAQGRRSNANANASARGAMPRKTEGLPGSLAVVKSSSDPQRDFRDSMLEMIVENNIRASKDLEELLACYLSLNSNEYHDVIVEVFEQIWFDLTSIRLQRPEKASLSQTNRNECKI